MREIVQLLVAIYKKISRLEVDITPARMGLCKFCRQKTGRFSSYHKNCRVTYQNGKKEIVATIIKSINSTSDYSSLDLQIERVATKAYIANKDLQKIHCNAFDKVVNLFIDSDALSLEQEERLVSYRSYYGMSDNLLNKNGAVHKLVKASILREVSEGRIPIGKVSISGPMPFVLQPSEVLIWVFKNARFYEKQTVTTYSGGSSGVSVRVAKGVYFRSSSFSGKTLKVEETRYIGTGPVVLTSKNIYFHCTKKAIKIPYKKLISIIPHEDGIGLQKDGVSAKPQFIKGLDGWFAYNLVVNLARI